MTKKNLNLMKIGTFLHDFLMNMDYKKTDIKKAEDVLKTLPESSFKKTKKFINEYSSIFEGALATR